MKDKLGLKTRFRQAFEFLLQQVENHEGGVESAILEAESTCSRLRRLEENLRRVRQINSLRFCEIEAEMVELCERARLSSREQEEEAIGWLSKRRKLSKDSLLFETEIAENEGVWAQISQDLALCEMRLTNLRVQREILRTRETRVELIEAANEKGGIKELDSEDSLVRWEAQIAAKEFRITHRDANCKSSDLKDSSEYEELKEMLCRLKQG